MKLKKVKIEDFKSIKSLEVNLHDLTCLVGQNESGKSNILEAISYLNFSKIKLSHDLLNKNSEKYETNGFPVVSGDFYFGVDEISHLEKYFRNYGEDESALIGIDGISVCISSDKIENVIILLIEKSKKSDIRKAIKKPENFQIITQYIIDELIPSIELFTSDDLELTSVTNQQLIDKSANTTAFFKLLSIGGINDVNILLGDPEKGAEKILHAQDKITELFLEFYSQDSSIKIEIVAFNNTWNVKFKDSTKRRYSLKEKSVGFRYFFAFFINKYYSIENADNDIIYLLDEPGVSLHPKGARDLLELFDEIVATDQIVYSTHNPFLTLRGHTDKLVLVKKTGEQGSIIHNKAYSNKYEVLRKELGLLLNDSFLVGEKNIVVEGVSDKYVLHHIIEELEEFEHLKWINIFSADSSTEIIPSIRYLNSLSLKGTVLLDDDNAAKNEISKVKFKELVIDSQNWSFITVTGKKGEEYTQKTLEDIFPPDHYLAAYNEYYFNEYENLNPIKPFTRLIIQNFKTPILDLIKPHHKDIFDTEQFNKVAVFRKLFELYPFEKNQATYKNVINLISKIDQSLSNLN